MRRFVSKVVIFTTSFFVAVVGTPLVVVFDAAACGDLSFLSVDFVLDLFSKAFEAGVDAGLRDLDARDDL